MARELQGKAGLEGPAQVGSGQTNRSVRGLRPTDPLTVLSSSILRHMPRQRFAALLRVISRGIGLPLDAGAAASAAGAG